MRQGGRWQAVGILVVSAAMLLGCAAGRELHYFATVDTNTGQPVNFFRLEVTGTVRSSSGRYVSGFYDERAVDLFLNEVKTSESVVRPFFAADTCKTASDSADCLAKLGTSLAVVPVGQHNGTTTQPDGVFVMILSNNADAISDTIGAFATNEVVLGSALRLLHSDTFEKAAETVAVTSLSDRRRAAGMAELGALIAGGESAATSSAREAAYLSALRTAARLAGLDGEISDIASARTLFGSGDGK